MYPILVDYITAFVPFVIRSFKFVALNRLYIYILLIDIAGKNEAIFMLLYNYPS